MQSEKPEFVLLDHTADLGIIVRGTSLKDLFERAARSMMHIMVRGKTSENASQIKLSVNGQDLADLMVRWLGEILYDFDGEKEVIIDVRIDTIFPSYLDATLKTVSFNPKIHEILCDIKAVTYHQIKVVEKNNCWEARIIFDL